MTLFDLSLYTKDTRDFFQTNMNDENPFADPDDMMDMDLDMELGGDMAETESFLNDEPTSSTNTNSTTTANQKQPATPAGGMCSCFTVPYYQPYFDVDTAMVQTRILRSFTALRPASRDFFEITKTNADLFGPFWSCCTLIFAIGVFANFSSYLSFQATSAQPRWYYDFTLMTGAAAFVFGFGFGVPAAMWGVAKAINLPLSLIQATCLFGYSMGVYIIATGMCMVPSDIISWFSIIVAAVISCSFVGLNLQTHFQDNGVRKSASSSFLGAVAIVQVIFAGLLKVYFFSHISPITDIPDPFVNGNSTRL